MAGPLHNRLDLSCEPFAVRRARRHAADVLQQWQVPKAVVDDALLIVDELVANAGRHTKPPPETRHDTSAVRPQVVRCTLNLRLMPDHLLIVVYDQDHQPPVLQRPSGESESGRGLLLVAGLSQAWGYTYPTPTSGKLVWARCVIPPVSREPRGSGDAAQGAPSPESAPGASDGVKGVRPNGAAMRALRTARQVSLRDMQARTGLDRGHLSRLERGLVGASHDTIRRYADALDVPTAAITHDR